jgi:low affinity Fe/Cu permease
MERKMNPTIEHIKSIGWVLLLVYVFLGLFTFISGRIVGYSLAIWVCGGLAVIVTIVFASILLFNIAIVSGFNTIKRLFKS